MTIRIILRGILIWFDHIVLCYHNFIARVSVNDRKPRAIKFSERRSRQFRPTPISRLSAASVSVTASAHTGQKSWLMQWSAPPLAIGHCAFVKRTDVYFDNCLWSTMVLARVLLVYENVALVFTAGFSGAPQHQTEAEKLVAVPESRCPFTN